MSKNKECLFLGPAYFNNLKLFIIACSAEKGGKKTTQNGNGDKSQIVAT